jgi:hypothetical protein
VLAVGHRDGVGRLAGDLGDVVVEARVPGGVELREHLAHRAQLGPQVRVRRVVERLVVGVVLELDDPDVPDGRQGRGASGRGERAEEDERREGAPDGHEPDSGAPRPTTRWFSVNAALRSTPGSAPRTPRRRRC